MKSSNVLNFESVSAVKGENAEFTENENQTFEGGVHYMPTLPSTFKSLVGKPVKIEFEEPRRVIELLGDLLGVTDYRTNKAAFWFLDIVALQVLRYKDDLDDHCKSVLISWLAGEMKFIRDNKLSRKDFFKEMRVLFLYVADKLSRGDPLLHWELLLDERCEITRRHSTVDVSAASEASMTNNLPEKSAENSNISLITNNSRADTFEDTVTESCSLTNPNIVLDSIIEATYSMYANELRYALVYEVFVTPIQIQTYCIPHTFRLPRQIKLAAPGAGPFNIKLHERLEKTANESTTNKKRPERKGRTNSKKGRAINDSNIEIPSTPPSSLIEEEIQIQNRRFILPLIEAKEAARVFEMHMESIQ